MAGMSVVSPDFLRPLMGKEIRDLLSPSKYSAAAVERMFECKSPLCRSDFMATFYKDFNSCICENAR